jgi:Protein of unknown function (DUF3175)
MSSRGKSTANRQPAKARRWSQAVTEHSDAIDLESGVFTQTSARKIAESLKRSAEASTRRKGSPFQSAMSVLNFEINRAGKGLAKSRLVRLERTKSELRKVFGRA